MILPLSIFGSCSTRPTSEGSNKKDPVRKQGLFTRTLCENEKRIIYEHFESSVRGQDKPMYVVKGVGFVVRTINFVI